MAPDATDMDNLTKAIAAIKRSNKRAHALAEGHVETVIDTLATPTIAELISLLRSGNPLTDAERKTAVDYFNDLALSAQDQSAQHVPKDDQTDE